MYTPNLSAAAWRKSSFSGETGTCVEVAVAGALVGVRDSKNIQAGHLTLAMAGWNGLVSAVKSEQLVR